MAIAIQYGTATISASVSGPGSAPYVDVTSTLTHTTDYMDYCQIISGVRDILGDVAVTATRLTVTSVRYSASRQLPAGSEIVFRWSSCDGTA
jgi:hypothetical protein